MGFILLYILLSYLLLHLIGLVSSSERMEDHKYKKYYQLTYNHIVEIFRGCQNFNLNIIGAVMLTLLTTVLLYVIKIPAICLHVLLKAFIKLLILLFIKKD